MRPVADGLALGKLGGVITKSISPGLSRGQQKRLYFAGGPNCHEFDSGGLDGLIAKPSKIAVEINGTRATKNEIGKGVEYQ